MSCRRSGYVGPFVDGWDDIGGGVTRVLTVQQMLVEMGSIVLQR